MIIITLRRGIVGIERISTDEEVILKDYDITEYPHDVKEDEIGKYVEEIL